MKRYEIGVALRYLTAARRRGHTAFLTIISTLGLAVGVATLIISLALLSGLQGQIKERLIASTPQILIEPSGTHSIEQSDEIVASLGSSRDVSVQPVIAGIAWASSESGNRGRPIRIRSFQPGEEPSADRSFGRRWEAKTIEDDARVEIFVTREFAQAMGLFLGDDVVIVAPRQRLTPFGPVPIVRTFRIARILASPLEEKDPDARLQFEDASRLFATDGYPTAIEIYAPIERSAEIEEALLAEEWPVIIRDWAELNKPLFLALRLEKIVMFATISLIIFVAALNLVSSVAMLIVEKRPQVGVLRTMGSTERSILEIYLMVGLFIGLFGTALGNLIGLGVSWAANHFELIPLPAGVYAIHHLPFRIEPSEIVAVNAVAVILSILATWYPARLASRLDPVIAIKGE
ncbi:MAG TPA: FtsX-like permease family protein [Thermoanaerobaculia bacterium]|nr:FtsX-like permease family protein [Thermoanaerobaculia bacterium]